MVAILKHLLSLLSTSPKPSPLVNHANVEGNTPLHWTALNHHLACLQLLVSAGADPSLVNKAGYDSVFEAERGIPDADPEKRANSGEEWNRVDEKTERGRRCAEWLLGCKEGGVLERGVKGGGDAVTGPSDAGADGDEENDTNIMS